MARSEGRIRCKIWTDGEFLARSPDAQRLYMLLVSQADINHCGVIGLRVRRWASCSAGTDDEHVVTALAELEEHRFVVVDFDTEEVLVRTFIRSDEVYKQPRVMLSALSELGEITSLRLQEALLAELDRIPVDELPDTPTARKSGQQGPSIRTQVTETLAIMRATLETALSKTDRTPAEHATANPKPTHNQPMAMPSATPLRAHEARAPARTPASPSPPPPAPTDVSDGTTDISTEQPTPTPLETHAAEAITDTGKRLLTAHIGHLRTRPPDRVIGQLARHIQDLLLEGINPTDITAGLHTLRTRNLNPAALPTAVNEHLQRPGPRRPDGPPCPHHNTPTYNGTCAACRADQLAGTSENRAPPTAETA